MDGQLPGFVGIAALFLGILANRFVGHDVSAQTVMTFAFIVGGAFIGFLPYNFFPQKIMPGYGGGALAGFLLGVLSILSFGKFGTAFLILAIPMLDAGYTIMRRIKNKKSPLKQTGDTYILSFLTSAGEKKNCDILLVNYLYPWGFQSLS